MRSAVGCVAVVRFFAICVLHHAVLCVEVSGCAVTLAVSHHEVRTDPVEQAEDAGGVAVDESGGHPDDPIRHREDLRHGVALAAVVVVLVEFVHNAAVKFPFVPALDIRTHWIAPAGPNGGGVPVRVFSNRPNLLQRWRVLCFCKVFCRFVAMDPAITTDLYPRAFSPRVDRRPKRCTAVRAFMVFAVFRAKEELIDFTPVLHTVLCK